MNRQRCVYDHFAVIDNLLPEEQFQTISRYIESLPFRPTNPGLDPIAKSEEPGFGANMFVYPSEPIVAKLTEENVSSFRAASRKASTEIIMYPTGAPFDEVFIAIKQEAAKMSQLLGKEGADWGAIVALAFAYGAGHSYRWHTDGSEFEDGRHYTGAFIYYAHTCWEADWGGQLLIEHDSASVGDGAYVSSIPNRLVILRGEVRHGVARLSGRAGDAFRRSLAGFFVTMPFASSLLTTFGNFNQE